MPGFRKPHDWVGPTPWEDIKAAFEVACPRGKYLMEISDPADIKVVTTVWNQGIDSRLEAITRPSTAKWGDKEKTVLKISLDISGLLVLLRRLFELEPGPATDLRSAMLVTLGIEEA